jgi:ribosome-binding protein aMBF1 (putative translation factor)
MAKRAAAERSSKSPPATDGAPTSGTHKSAPRSRDAKGSSRVAASTPHGREFDDLAARLGSRLRDLRAARGWSQRATADRIGIGAAVVCRLEKGSANPSLAILVSVARAFGIPLRRLLER